MSSEPSPSDSADRVNLNNHNVLDNSMGTAPSSDTGAAPNVEAIAPDTVESSASSAAGAAANNNESNAAPSPAVPGRFANRRVAINLQAIASRRFRNLAGIQFTRWTFRRGGNQPAPPAGVPAAPAPAAAHQPPPAGAAMPLNTMRDRLFYQLFMRMTITYARFVPPQLRRLIEFMVLVKALSFLLVLSYVHYKLSSGKASCLQHIEHSWPRHGIVRVFVTKHLQAMVIPPGYVPPQAQDMILERSLLAMWPGEGVSYYDVKQVFVGPSNQYYDAYEKYDNLYVYDSNRTTVDDTSLNAPDNATEHNITIVEQTGDNGEANDSGTMHISPEESLAHSQQSQSVADTATPAPLIIDKELAADQQAQENAEEEDTSHFYEYAVEYALEYGFLRLSQKTRDRLQIPVMTVVLNPDTDSCFGDSISKFILSDFLGYEDVLLSSVKILAEDESTNKGYLRDLITGEHYRFVDIGSTRLFYVAAFLIMIVFTFGISMLLRFSHHQIFLFIVDLLQMFEMNQAVTVPAAPLLTVILALVGMEAIMSEFFNETTTAFYVIMMVWVADQFDSICCHSTISRRYWLRFFYLYQFAFYAYTYRFNGQFNGLALLTSWLFIQHSMIYFFHHYEIPLILHENRVQRLLHDLHEGTFEQNNTNNANAAATPATPATPAANGNDNVHTATNNTATSNAADGGDATANGGTASCHATSVAPAESSATGGIHSAGGDGMNTTDSHRPAPASDLVMGSPVVSAADSPTPTTTSSG